MPKILVTITSDTTAIAHRMDRGQKVIPAEFAGPTEWVIRYARESYGATNVTTTIATR